MRLFALAPAFLFVLVSMCGSSVPAPGGTVSGTAFLDANHNAIRDKCDSNLANADVILTATDGTTATIRSGTNGAFTFEHVPAGDARVTLGAQDGFAYPVTTRTEDGEPGVVARVKNLAETDGLLIGSASRSTFSADSPSVLGFVFRDENANGIIDENECGWSGLQGFDAIRAASSSITGIREDGTFEIRNLSDDSEVSLTINDPESPYYMGGSQWYEPTTDVTKSSLCSLTVEPRERYGKNLYEATFGFTESIRPVGSLSGTAFADDNGNGVHDRSESTVSNVSVVILPPDDDCATVNFGSTYVGADGTYARYNIPDGTYTLLISPPPMNPEGDTLYVGPDTTATITISGVTEYDIPLRIVPAANVFLTAFDDRNANGEQDAGEPGVLGLSICLGESGFIEGARDVMVDPRTGSSYPGPGEYACGYTNRDGAAKIGPFKPGAYPVQVDAYGSASAMSAPPALSVDLALGEQLTYNLPVDVISAGEQLLPPGVGTDGKMTVCYDDPAWVQPPYDGTPVDVSIYSGYFDVEHIESDEEIYSFGIYPGYGPEFAIWTTLANLDTWSYGGIESCINQTGPLIAFANYEPVSSQTDGVSIVQVTLRRADTGLWAAFVPVPETRVEYPELPPPVYIIFVDEDHNPLARCTGYAGACEWYGD